MQKTEKTEYVWVEKPHQGRPFVSHVMNSSELDEFLIQHCVDDDFSCEAGLTPTSDQIDERAGRDKYSAGRWTKSEVLEHIKQHRTTGHLAIELLTELKKVADNEGWRTERCMFTNTEIARSQDLWGEYVDPDGEWDYDEWDNSTLEERMDHMNSMHWVEEEVVK